MSTLVIVDSHVNDYETLLTGLASDTEILVLAPDENGVRQIADFLAEKSGYDAVHVLSHGDGGRLFLGDSVINQKNLESESTLWQDIGKSLNATGDILLYGCDVAAGEAGQAFIATLAQLTGADVAASNNVTGSAAQAGDWVLESRIGVVETTALNSLDYRYTLADTTPPVAPKLVTSAAFHYLADPQVTIQTNMGTVVVELHPEQAPVTVANMLAYVAGDFYDGTLFHRVIEGFMVQGGGFNSGLVYKTPTYAAIALESNNGLANMRGTIAMARTSDANSATSQFFINQVDNSFLNYSSAASPGYAVFGHVLSGLSVIDSIAQVSTNSSDAPLAKVTITSVNLTGAGSGISNANTLLVSDLEAGASWSYSLNGGTTWQAGSGNSITLPLGTYAADAIQVRQTDAAGNTSLSTGKLSSSLVITDHAITAPTVSISDNLAGTANRTTSSLSYSLNFSEAVSGLTASDFIVSHGSVSSVTGSGSSWTVSVTPEPGVASGTIGLTLRSGAVTDAAGDPNAVISNSSQAIDTLAPVAPKLVTSSAFNYLINPQITMQTSLGTVVIELSPKQAPITVANMLAYVDAGFYDNTLFHQVIPSFVLQGGSYVSGLDYKPPVYGPITLESNNGLANVRGSIGMVHGSTANSATNEFFINLADNSSLNYSSSTSPGYAVFGHIVSGLAVIDSIAQVPTTTTSPTYVPLTEVSINSIRQTVAGSSLSNVNSLQLSDLEAGASWSYSLDGGTTWHAGTGSSLILPDGSYAANAIQVRQTDTAGNLSASTGKLTSALVVDTVAPTVAGFTPADEAAAVDLNSNIVITFSEAIARGTGSIVLKTSAGAIVESFDAAGSARLTIAGTTLTIDPTASLAYTPGYRVEFAAGTLKDLAGNNYAGTTSYNFTTNHLPAGSVAISGTVIQGQMLTASNTLSDSDGLGAISYQWQANGIDISGATAGTYQLTSAEIGKSISVVALYTDGHGLSEQVASAATTPVQWPTQGTAGNDVLTANSASDPLVGGLGDDLYTVLAGTNVITEFPNAGTDTVQAPLSWTLGTNLENLTLLGTHRFSGTGNSQDNILTGNDADNLLNGGRGADTLIGGGGNDTYVVDDAGDTVQETQTASTQIDTVRSWVDWTLGANLESLTLLGTKNLNGTGNGLDNALIGNGGTNVLNGGAGNDRLDGASGNDTLTGGDGADTFAFSTPLNEQRNVDTITDFVSGVDTLELSAAIFRQIGFSGGPGSASFFHAGSAAHDADDRILYDTASGALYYDADGTGALAAVQFATLQGAPSLLYNDLFVG